jgi:hypothetical protein
MMRTRTIINVQSKGVDSRPKLEMALFVLEASDKQALQLDNGHTSKIGILLPTLEFHPRARLRCALYPIRVT